MTFDEFDNYLNGFNLNEQKLSSTKGKEYANSNERFGNFNRLAERLKTDRLKIAYTYMTKHLDAIESYINNHQTYSDENIQGRIQDAVLYLKLIGGMIWEEQVERDRVEEFTKIEYCDKTERNARRKGLVIDNE